MHQSQVSDRIGSAGEDFLEGDATVAGVDLTAAEEGHLTHQTAAVGSDGEGQFGFDGLIDGERSIDTHLSQGDDTAGREGENGAFGGEDTAGKVLDDG